jgi:hypothetical protein
MLCHPVVTLDVNISNAVLKYWLNPTFNTSEPEIIPSVIVVDIAVPVSVTVATLVAVIETPPELTAIFETALTPLCN